MAKNKKYQCPNPECGQPLEGWECLNCKLDLRELFTADDYRAEDVARALASIGTYVDQRASCLVVPAKRADSRSITVALNKTPDNLERSHTAICLNAGLSRRKFNINFWKDFLHWVWNDDDDEIVPRIHLETSGPLLALVDNELVWPFTRDTPGMRLYRLPLPNGKPLGVRYTGPIVEPQHTGALNEFLAETLCATAEDRLALRGWLLGSLLSPGVVGLGQMPGLFLAASNYGAGKTATVDVLAEYLGGRCMPIWNKDQFEDWLRASLGSRMRLCCVDNVPETEPFSSSLLASFMTSQLHDVRTFYETMGTTTVPNTQIVVATGNSPNISPELISRFVAVSLDGGQRLNNSDKEVERWLSYWQGMRTEVMADMLATAIDNWKQGPFEGPVRRSRFAPWMRATARILRTSPLILPRKSLVQTPLEQALDVVWQEDQLSEEVGFEALCESMSRIGGPGIERVTKQINMSEAGLMLMLSDYDSKYQFDRRPDGLWIRRCE